MRTRTKKTKCLPDIEFVYVGGGVWWVMKRDISLDVEEVFDGVSFVVWKYAGMVRGGPPHPTNQLVRKYKEENK